MTVISARLADERVAVDAADRAQATSSASSTGRGAEPEALPGLVELDGEGPVHVEVAGLDRQVVGLEGSAALLVDDVERADEPDVVDEVGEVAGPSAAIEVADEGRPADGPEDEVRAAEHDVPLRVPGVELELGRRQSRPAPRPGPGRGGRCGRSVDRRAGAANASSARSPRHLHADLGQDPQRRPVDRLDLVGRQDLERPERVDQPAPGQLLRDRAPRGADGGAGRRARLGGRRVARRARSIDRMLRPRGHARDGLRVRRHGRSELARRLSCPSQESERSGSRSRSDANEVG